MTIVGFQLPVLSFFPFAKRKYQNIIFLKIVDVIVQLQQKIKKKLLLGAVIKPQMTKESATALLSSLYGLRFLPTKKITIEHH